MTLNPPQAPRHPHVLTAHGHERHDDWYWLRDRNSAAVIEYLHAENDYTAAVTASTESLRTTLFEELRNHVQLDDVSAPVRWGPYLYSSRTETGKQYSIHERSDLDASNVEVLLDENLEASNHEYFAVGDFAVDPAHQLAAYTTDHSGAELYTLRIREFATGSDRSDVLEGVYYSVAWSQDSANLFYTKPDNTMRPYQIWRHTLGNDQTDDVCIFEELDERFDVWVEASRSGGVIFVGVQSRTTSEVHFVSATDCTMPLRCIAERSDGVEYHVDHLRGDGEHNQFVIWSNANGCTNFELYEVSVSSASEPQWDLLIAHDPAVRIAQVSAFATFLCLYERTNGLERLRIRYNNDGSFHTIGLPDPVYTVWPGSTPEFATSSVRYQYSSLVQPRTTFDFDVTLRASVLVKQQPVLGYTQSEYVTKRAWATAADGTRVPISIAHRYDTPLDGTAPLYLYGYGSYEASIDPMFDSDVLPLLDRGWIYAIGHPRGGGEMGRAWWEGGRMQHKMNTFTDFIACAQHVIDIGLCDADRIVTRGRSAGGLLMGAIATMRPELWRAVVAEVPFVDVVSTMSDATIPLTVGEWEEWGNPENINDYRTILAYSPYDNLRSDVEYPSMLITGGLNDPRVQYWEPAKFAAKLRALSPTTPVLLKTEMGAGHGGPSGRYEQWRDEAFVLAWMLTADATRSVR